MTASACAQEILLTSVGSNLKSTLKIKIKFRLSAYAEMDILRFSDGKQDNIMLVTMLEYIRGLSAPGLQGQLQ